MPGTPVPGTSGTGGFRPKAVVTRVRGIQDVAEIRIRWLGHRMHAEVDLAVSPELSVTAAHEMANEVRHEMLHRLPYLSSATIHVDPVTKSGEAHHRILGHQHDAGPEHSH